MVGTGYLFTAVSNPAALRAMLAASAQRQALRGTILVAPEGVNIAVHGTALALDALVAVVRAWPGFADFELRRSDDFGQLPYRRLKVQCRRELVALGRNGDPLEHAGAQLVSPADWPLQLDDPTITLVDLRNDYEVAAGTFPGALNPGTSRFRDFPAWAERKLRDKAAPVALFCTGGIRCAKAAAWMRGQGWQDLRELKGGILAYLEAAGAGESRWRGECFVFDERVSLVEGLRQGAAEICRGCGKPLLAGAQVASEYEAGVSCAYCRSGAK